MNINIYSESESYARPDGQVKRYHSALITEVGEVCRSRLPQFVRAEDFDKLLVELERVKSALKFYADRDHFSEDIGNDWDSVSGEPASILWHEHEAWFVEDGSIARAALENKA